MFKSGTLERAIKNLNKTYFNTQCYKHKIKKTFFFFLYIPFTYVFYFIVSFLILFILVLRFGYEPNVKILVKAKGLFDLQ